MNQDQMTCPLTKGERILVALDGSQYSQAALEQAVSLGKTCNSRIYVITVVDLYPAQLELAPQLHEKMTRQANQLLDDARGRIEKENIPCETILHTGGQPHEFIVDEARDKNIDLIVMGTHGRTGLKRFFMGSVAEKVIGHSPCSVMVVPSPS
jgi:nucleotide-binding universal stress UspA family protein